MLRNCALDCAPFAALLEAWRSRDREAAAFRAKGGKVVGCLGADVPEEYILAAGMLPLRIAPDPGGSLEYADRYLEACFDPQVRSQFDRIVRPGEKPWDYLAVSNSTDVLVRTYLYLRELRRTEPEAGVPDTAFIDWLFTPSPVFRRYNEARAADFRRRTEEWAGRAVTDGDVREACEVLNGERSAMGRIYALRQEALPRVSGTEALVIAGAGFYMDRARHRDLVNAVADAAAAWPEIPGPRLFFSGTEQFTLTVYGYLEEAGGVIVGEDQDCGMRYYQRLTDRESPPETAVADRYIRRVPSPKKAGVSRRVEALCCQALESRAAGVAVCMNRFEEAASWDFPEEKKALEAEGVRAAEFCRLPWPPEGDETLRGRMGDFVRMLKGGGENG